MLKKVSNGLSYYVFEIFEGFPELSCGVFTRYGPDGEDFNLSYEHGTRGEVNRNILLAREALGLGPLAFVNQAHGDGILEPEASYAPLSPSELRGGYDALICRPGGSLMIKLADCQGIILYSPERRVLALVHSGWRGSVLNIVGKTLRWLVDKLGADPLGVRAGVGPSIGPCHMEFKSYEKDLPRDLWKYRVDSSGDYFDFWALTRDQLLREGVLPGHIEFSGKCSYCEEEFYSHRRGDGGRFAIMGGILL
jgi:YfiH family protein